LVYLESPHFIDWVITSKCNLNCRHCRGMSDGGLSPERARMLIEEIVRLKPKWLIIEGGEPLLRQDIFIILERMKQAGLDVHVITNGMLLSPEVIAKLKRLAVKVMISIDGANKATYESIRPGASYEQVLEAARNCSRQGLLSAINFTILRRNYQEIPAIFELAVSLGFPKVNLIGLKPCHNYQEERLSADEYEKAIRLTCEASRKHGVEFFFDEPFFRAAIKEWKLDIAPSGSGAGIVVPDNSACIFGEYLFIEPNGDVKPCSFAQYVLGNVIDKPLDNIWQEALNLPLLKNIRNPKERSGRCRRCTYVEKCYGCRSRAFAITGDWYASDPACPLPVK
jgi:radical SAM protein with 4Fe4S-binding SPASM domain